MYIIYIYTHYIYIYIHIYVRIHVGKYMFQLFEVTWRHVTAECHDWNGPKRWTFGMTQICRKNMFPAYAAQPHDRIWRRGKHFQRHCVGDFAQMVRSKMNSPRVWLSPHIFHVQKLLVHFIIFLYVQFSSHTSGQVVYVSKSVSVNPKPQHLKSC